MNHASQECKTVLGFSNMASLKTDEALRNHGQQSDYANEKHSGRLQGVQEIHNALGNVMNHSSHLVLRES